MAQRFPVRRKESIVIQPAKALGAVCNSECEKAMGAIRISYAKAIGTFFCQLCASDTEGSSFSMLNVEKILKTSVGNVICCLKSFLFASLHLPSQIGTRRDVEISAGLGHLSS